VWSARVGARRSRIRRGHPFCFCRARSAGIIKIRCRRCDRHGRLSVKRLLAEWRMHRSATSCRSRLANARTATIRSYTPHLCGRPPGGKGFLASGYKFLAPLAIKTLWFINRKFSAEAISVFGSSLVVCFSRMKSRVQRQKETPVGCALMSGLLRAIGRWPSWVCAYVSGTNQRSVLEGASGCSVLPELSFDQPFPSRCSAFPAGISQARA